MLGCSITCKENALAMSKVTSRRGIGTDISGRKRDVPQSEPPHWAQTSATYHFNVVEPFEPGKKCTAKNGAVHVTFLAF
jgi:hypothetical protein